MHLKHKAFHRLRSRTPQWPSVSNITLVITHADGSRTSIAIIHVCDSVRASVCPHDKTKMAEN